MPLISDLPKKQAGWDKLDGLCILFFFIALGAGSMACVVL